MSLYMDGMMFMLTLISAVYIYPIVSVVLIIWVLSTMFLNAYRELISEITLVSGTYINSSTIAIVIIMESALFASFFYIAFHLDYFPLEGIIRLDNAIVITYILSTAAIITDYLLISNSLRVVSYKDTLLFTCMLMLVSIGFNTMLVGEYQLVSFNYNSYSYGCMFYIITGLHFSHVVVGVLLILTYPFFQSVSLYTDYGKPLSYLSSSVVVVSTMEMMSLQIMYWHFVELLWTFILLILYT